MTQKAAQRVSNNIQDLKKEEKRDNPEVESLEQLNIKISGLKNQFTNEINRLNQKNYALEREIIKLNQKNDALEGKNYALEGEIIKLKKEREQDALKIKELSEFILLAKIRKLLKKMLEYIVNSKYLSEALEYNKENKKLSFNKVPKGLNILGFTNSDIITALNTILEIIFSYSSYYDYKLLFVEKKPKNLLNIEKT